MNEARIRAVWECELDRLEIDVVRAERLLKSLDAIPAEPWDPPAVPGQMPADLALRAQELLDRQERAGAELASALATAQRQFAYGERVSGVAGGGQTRPVYLDLEA